MVNWGEVMREDDGRKEEGGRSKLNGGESRRRKLPETEDSSPFSSVGRGPVRRLTHVSDG